MFPGITPLETGMFPRAEGINNYGSADVGAVVSR